MAEQLQIQVQANVSNAITNLNNLQKNLAETNTAAVKTGTTGMQTLSKGAGQANTAMINLGRTVSDAPFGFIGIANNIGPLVENFVSLRKESGSSGSALKQLGSSLIGPGGLIVGIQLAVAAVQFAQLGLSRWTKKTKEAKNEQDEIAKSIAGQYTQVLLLKSAYEKDKSLEGRREILKQLNQVSNVYFGNLKAEETSIKQLQSAYDGYINNLLQSFAVKQLEADLEPLVKQLAVAQSTVRKLGPDLEKLGLIKSTVGLTGQALADAIKFNNELQNGFRNLSDQQRKALAPSGVFQYNAALNESNKLWNQINDLISNQSVLFSKSVTQTKNGKNSEQSLQEKINELLSDYKNTLQSIKYEEQIRGLNLSNQKLETNLDFLKRAADLVGFTGDAYKTIAKDTQDFVDAASKQKIVDVITAYQTAISELDIKQAVTGQDQLNARINAATDSLIKLKTLGVESTNEEFIKLQNTLNGLQAEVGLREIRKRTEEITKTWERFQLQVDKLNFNKTKEPLDALKSKIDLIGNAIQELKSKGLTDADLGIQLLNVQFEQLGKQFEKLKAQKELFDQLQQTISGGLTNAFTSVFEAIADGEDAFKALGDSVKRLALDLIRVVIQMQVVKALANIIAPGSGKLFASNEFQTLIRGDMLRAITLGR